MHVFCVLDACRPFATAHFNLSKQLSLLCLLGMFEAAFLDAAWIFSKNTPALFENSAVRFLSVNLLKHSCDMYV